MLQDKNFSFQNYFVKVTTFWLIFWAASEQDKTTYDSYNHAILLHSLGVTRGVAGPKIMPAMKLRHCASDHVKNWRGLAVRKL